MPDHALFRIGLLPTLQDRLGQVEAYCALEPVWQRLVVKTCCERLGAHLALCLLEDYSKFAASETTAFSAWLSTVVEGGLPQRWAASRDFPTRFFETYPVARRACERVAVDAVGFATRVRRTMLRDHATIVATLGEAFDSDHLIEADPAIGDFHDGQSTTRLRYASGDTAYWKPRQALPEAAFYELWDILQRQLGWRPEAAPKIVPLGEAHLVKHIARQACADRDLYWQKSGALLALATLLGVRDLHFENIVAAGSCPMPVDLEVMLAGFSQTHGKTLFRPIDVYRTGLLPCQSDEPEFPEIGGLFSSAPLSRTRYLDASGQRGRVGADVVLEPRNPTESNIPISTGGMCSARDLEHLQRGYAEAVVTLKDVFGTICNAEVISKLEEVQPRTIVVGTQGYYRILRSASQAHLMRDVAEHEAFLATALDEELLRRGRRLSCPVRDATISALTSWDVPLHRDQSFAGGVRRGELDHVLGRRLHDMQRSLAMQEHLIKVCGFARMESGEDGPIAPCHASVEDAIEDIYASLQKLVFHDAHGPVVVGLRERASINADPCILVDEMGPGYYAGRSGVAIALAAYGSFRGNDAAVVSGLSLLSTCVRDYDNLPEKDLLVPALYGVDEGIAGLVYALSVAKRLLPAHESDIRALFERVSPRIELLTVRGHCGPSSKDVLTGTSGMILALVAAGRAFGGASAVLASGLATKLIGEPQPAMGPGLLHGASGVALALLRVFELTGDEKFLRAAREYLEQDDLAIQSGKRAETGRFDISWCHGILGNLTAKMLYARVNSDSAYSREAIETLAKMRKQVPRFNNAAACCGSFGLVLFEQVLGDHPDVFGAPASKHECVAPNIVKHALNADWKATGGNAPLIYSAGLFTGMSGVLYSMLRSVDSALPNFAVFD